MTKTTEKRRTQAERRAESRQAVLDSASRLFGEKGYSATSLEEIAADCGLTIRPIYHYFGNKKALFAAVNGSLEAQIVMAMAAGDGAGDIVASWRAFLELCDDPGFRQIVLIDSPNVLGRERWAESEVSRRARRMFASDETQAREQRYRAALLTRMLMGAFTEAALMIAEATDVALAKQQAEQMVTALFGDVSTLLVD